MTAEQTCCTLDQGKRLLELGITRESLFCFIGDPNPDPKYFVPYELYYTPDAYTNCGASWYENRIPVFTVAELSVMLPDYYPSWRFKGPEGKDIWIATVICGPKPVGIDDVHTAHEFDRHGETQAQALATLLISLLETKIITADQVNQRLSAI